MEAVRQSVFTQKVTYRNNGDGTFGVIAGSKSSSTQVGCQMEIDDDYIDKMEKVEDVDYPGEGRNLANFADRYAVYASAFIDYSGNRPISFYCGDKLEHFASITAETVKFY